MRSAMRASRSSRSTDERTSCVRRAFSCAIAIALCSACGGRQLPIRPASRSFTAGDYERLYGDWTRASDEFSFGRLEDVLHVTATFESWEFRWAYVVRYA